MEDKINKLNDIIILGGGLAGLGCYHALGEGKIYEADDRVGGHAKSNKIGGYYFDQGAHICHSKNEDWLNLIDSKGDGINISKGIVNNYRQGIWHKYPVQNNLRSLDEETKLNSLVDFVKSNCNNYTSDPENYKEWCIRQYGIYLTENFYKPFTKKYWRTNLEDLATDWLSGRLIPSQIQNVVEGSFKDPSESQAVFNYFKYPKSGGFFKLFKGIFNKADISTSMKATEISLLDKTISFESGEVIEFKHIASSIPLPTLVHLIKESPKEIRDEADKLKHLSLIQINLILENVPRDKYKSHWFYIYDEDIDISRVSIINNLTSDKTKNGELVIQAEIFRRCDETYDIPSLVNKGVNDLMKIFDFNKSNIKQVKETFVPYSYVISDHFRKKATAKIFDWLKKENVFTMGLYGKWEYVWSDKAYSSGFKEGIKIKEILNKQQ